MAEQIMSASGTQYGVAVGEDNRLWVDAAISGIPTVNANITGSIMIGSVSAQVDSIYVQSGDNINISSMPEVVGVSGTYFQDIIGSVQVNSGSIYITNLSASSGYAGSDTYVRAGSVIVTNTIQTAGSIWSIPEIEVAIGSESFIPAGSVIVTNNITLNDVDTIGSYPIQTIDGTVTANTGLYAGSDAYVVAGSVIVTNNISINSPAAIGSYDTQNIIGSVQIDGGSLYVTNFEQGTGYAGSDVYVKAGSIIVTNTVQTAGSIWSIPDFSIDNLYTGSNAYIPAGSVIITNNIGIVNPETIGSLAIQTIDGAITADVSGIVTVDNRVAGSIVNMPIIGVSGTYFHDITGSFALTNIGSVIQSTSPWIIVGSVYQTNSTEVETGSKSYNYIKSGTVWIEEPEYLKVVPSGTLTVTGTVNATTGLYAGSDAYIPAGSIIVTNSITINEPKTIGSYTTQTIDGTVIVSDLATAGSLPVQTIDGTVIVSDLATAGSIPVQTVDGTVTATTGLYAGSDSYIPAGSVIVTNDVSIDSPETIGSLAIQTIDGTVGVTDLYIGSDVYIPAGSVIVTNNIAIANPTTIGSLSTQTVDGTVNATTGLYAGSDAFIPAGSVIVTNTITGSITSIPNIYIQSGANLIGSIYHLEVAPNSDIMNNEYYDFKYLISGTATGVTGSTIGSIVQFIGAGSYIQVLTWTNDFITSIGSWS